MADEGMDHPDALHVELARLRAENEELRGLFRIAPDARDEDKRVLVAYHSHAAILALDGERDTKSSTEPWRADS